MENYPQFAKLRRELFDFIFDHPSRNKVADYFAKNMALRHYCIDDIRFILGHTKGCTLDELAKYLGRSSFKHILAMDRITPEKQTIGKPTAKRVGFQEMARVIARDHNWVTIYQVAHERSKDYYTLERYCENGFFGNIELNLSGKKSIHISTLTDFNARYTRAAAALKQHQHAKPHPPKVRTELKPWIYHSSTLTADQISQKYCGDCNKCRLIYFRSGGELVCESFVPKDVSFIIKHKIGCTTNELRLFLEISRGVMRKYVQKGYVEIAFSERVGKEVHHHIGYDNMVNVLSLAHNWISLFQLSHDLGHSYNAVLKYANDGCFGVTKNNLTGVIAINRCVISRFEELYQAKKAQGLFARGKKKHHIAVGEIALFTLADMAEQPYSAVAHWVDKIAHVHKHGLTTFKFDDIKRFIIEVAQKKQTLDFAQVETLLTKPPFADDERFIKYVRLARKKSSNRVGGLRAALGNNQFCLADVAEIALAKSGTVQNWFDYCLEVGKVGRLKVTNLARIKQLILAIYKREYLASPKWADNILVSKRLGDTLKQDKDFMRQVEEAQKRTI